MSKVFAGLRYDQMHIFCLLALGVCLSRPCFWVFWHTLMTTELDGFSRDLIIRVFRVWVRFSFSLRQRDSVDCHMTELMGCETLKFLKIMNSCFMNKLITTDVPAYLFDQLVFSYSSAQDSSVYDYFLIRCVAAWNSLPVSFRWLLLGLALIFFILDFSWGQCFSYIICTDSVW